MPERAEQVERGFNTRRCLLTLAVLRTAGSVGTVVPGEIAEKRRFVDTRRAGEGAFGGPMGGKSSSEVGLGGGGGGDDDDGVGGVIC